MATSAMAGQDNPSELRLDDFVTLDIGFESLLFPGNCVLRDDLDTYPPNTDPFDLYPGLEDLPEELEDLVATFGFDGTRRSVGIVIDKTAGQGHIRGLPGSSGRVGDHWFSFCWNTGLGLCDATATENGAGTTVYTLTGSGARALVADGIKNTNLVCENNGLATVKLTVSTE